MKILIGKGLVMAGLTLCAFTAQAEDHGALIERARSAAPAMVSADATIMYRGEVLVEGNNGWVCLPETLPDDGSPMCNDAVWMEMMQAVGSKAPYEAKQMGFSYMLQGDGPQGGVSNSDPYHADHLNAKDFIREGPHLMIIVPGDMAQDITDDPHSGGPYVMWKGTPYAHIMVPIGDRQ